MDLQNINIQDLFGRRIIDLTGAELSLLIYDATVRAYNNVMHESGVNKQAQPILFAAFGPWPSVLTYLKARSRA